VTVLPGVLINKNILPLPQNPSFQPVALILDQGYQDSYDSLQSSMSQNGFSCLRVAIYTDWCYRSISYLSRCGDHSRVAYKVARGLMFERLTVL
jgi:hypothetical protein